MSEPVLSRAALRDIDAILDFLRREAGERTAIKYRLAFLQQLDLLNDQPRIGTPRPELGRNVRSRVVAPYLIFFIGTSAARRRCCASCTAAAASPRFC